MLAKKHRVVRREDILAILRSRYRLRNKVFGISILSAPDCFQLLVIIPKKVSKKATKRNYIRRRIHAIIQEQLDERAIPGHIKIAIHIYSEDILDLPFNVLRSNILDCLGKLYFNYVDLKKSKPK